MNNVKKYRKELGLTLEGLADRAGTTKSYIWEIEQNHRVSPSLKKCYAISKVLCRSVYDVFPDEQEYNEEVVTIKVINKKPA